MPDGHPLPAGGNPFADDANPYAAPRAEGQYLHNAPPYAGLWRQSGVLVMHRNAPLPDICLKSNQPAKWRIRRNLQWHHPALTLSILAGVLVYLILAMCLTKRATIQLPLSEEWYQLRRRRIIFAWAAGLAGLAVFGSGFLLALEPGRGGFVWLLIVGLVVIVGALIYGQYATALVRPQKITDQYIWLNGVHPDFLDRLEVWQWTV